MSDAAGPGAKVGSSGFGEWCGVNDDAVRGTCYLALILVEEQVPNWLWIDSSFVFLRSNAVGYLP